MSKSIYICANCKLLIKRYPSTVRNLKQVFCSRKCQGRHQKTALLGEANPNYRYGAKKSKCKCGRKKDYRAKECSECARRGYPRKEENKLISDDKIRLAIPLCSSILEIANKLGTSRKRVGRLIQKENIDVSHMIKCCNRPYLPEEILVVNVAKRQNATVRRVILEHDLLPYKCSKCNLGPEWNGKSLIIELDHINGDPHDNRLENLRFLCPNCHSQTKTNKGKNSRGKPKQKRR